MVTTQCIIGILYQISKVTIIFILLFTQIREVFFNIGAAMTLQQFDDIYNEAAKRDPKGDVSVESFRSVLDEIRAAEVSESEHNLKTQLKC